LEALKDSKRLKKLVISSSSACYGDVEELPTTELAPINCMSPYALQKYASEQYSLILGERFGIPVVSLRYFNVYGPRSFNAESRLSAYSSVIGVFNNQLKNKQTLTITGDGSQSRDFVHVRDVGRANVAAAMSDVTGEVFNVGFGRAYTILETARFFSDDYTFIPERMGEALATLADISKIKRELGWAPQITLADGIKELKESQ
jgi:UDP-glucose 4-epimerase